MISTTLTNHLKHTVRKYSQTDAVQACGISYTALHFRAGDFLPYDILSESYYKEALSISDLDKIVVVTVEKSFFLTPVSFARWP